MNPAADIATIKDVDRAIFVHLEDQIITADNPSLFYKVLGHQPDSKILARLDEQIPLIWIKRTGPPVPSTFIGTTPQLRFKVETVDGENNPTSYKSIKGGVKSDLTYEVRYICFGEDDERAMVVQLSERFPRHLISLTGPDSNGPFIFETTLSTDVPGIRKNELGGIYRVIARGVTLGEREIETITAILNVEPTIEAQTSAP